MKMKKVSLFLSVATAMMVAFSSCKNNDDGPPILVEDGVYLVGAATPWTELADAARLTSTPNENGGGDASAEIFEIYAPLTTGNFNISVVSGGKETLNGGTLTDTYEGSENPGDLPMEPAYYYTLAKGGNFSVNQAGMYHIVYYKNVNKLVITKAIWGIRGGMNSWGFTAATPSADFKTWTLAGVDVTSNGMEWKFAYSGGWKLGLDNLDAGAATVRVNTNFGSTKANNGEEVMSGVIGTNVNASLLPGGKNYGINKGIYTFVLTWTNGVWSATVTKTAESQAPDFPEFLYVVGNGTTAGWTPANGVTLYPVNSQPGKFYGVVWLKATGSDVDGAFGFKFCIKKDWGGDFGAASPTAGTGEFAKGSDNIPVPGPEGLYTIVVDLTGNGRISVVNPVLYGMGNAFAEGDAGWTVKTYAFTVRGTENLVSPAAAFAGNLRAYVSHPWFEDGNWWQSEVNVNPADGKIVYRSTGGDPAAYPLTVGQKVVFNFKTGTATKE